MELHYLSTSLLVIDLEHQPYLKYFYGSETLTLNPLMIVRVPVTRSRFMMGIILGPENPMEHCKVLEDNLSYDVGSVILYRLRVLGQWGMALRNNRGWCLKQLMHLPIRSLHHRNVVEQMAMLSSFALLDLNYPLVCFARATQLCCR